MEISSLDLVYDMALFATQTFKLVELELRQQQKLCQWKANLRKCGIQVGGSCRYSVELLSSFCALIPSLASCSSIMEPERLKPFSDFGNIGVNILHSKYSVIC